MRIRTLWLFACSLAATAATPLTITTAAMPDGSAFVPYSFQLQATGGTAPYTWTSTSFSQYGIELDSATGVIHGVPQNVGLGILVTVTDSVGLSAQKLFRVYFWGPAHLWGNGTFPPASTAFPYSYLPFTDVVSVSLVSGVLPAGFVLEPNGRVYGNPTYPGIYNFTLKATGFAGDTLTANCTLTVFEPLSISLSPSFTVPLNQSASITWALTGGVGPYSASVTGQPEGMNLSGYTSLVGTPVRAGSYRVTVKVSDHASLPVQAFTTVTVLAPLSVAASNLTARQNSAFSSLVDATGGLPLFSWRITGGALPSGLALSSAGLISGLITGPPGKYSFTVTVTDSRASSASAQWTLLVTGPSLVTQALPHAQVGTAYTQTLKATGGAIPYVWSQQGVLPPGLALDGASGAITGVPLTAGAYAFAARATDTLGSYNEAALPIVVEGARLALSPPPTAVGNAGSPYTILLAASGGVAPYRFALDSGSLPEGVALSEAGVLGGTPVRKGTWTFTIRVQDASQQTAKLDLTIQIAGAIPQVTSGSLVNAASFLGALAPGGYFSIFGKNLAAYTEAAQSLPLTTSIGGVSVQWNGAWLPLLAISPGQINAQLPFDAVVGAGELQVTSDSIASVPIAANVKAAAPGLFQISPGFVLAINEDGTLNSSSSPAPVGSVVVMYATGGGNYDAPLTTGGAVPIDRLYRLALTNLLVIGGLTAETLFAGAAPALGTGLVQINARIPEVGAGVWAVTFLVGGVASNAPQIFVSGPVK